MWAALISLVAGLFSLLFKAKSPIVQEAEALGEQTQKVSDLQSQVKTQAAVASAEVNAPSTLSGVEDRLEKGTF